MNFEILWAYCDLCECVTAICPTCKNNMCNGGKGRIADEMPCLDCDRTYDEWDSARKENRIPYFTEAKTYIAGAQENLWDAQVRMKCKKL